MSAKRSRTSSNTSKECQHVSSSTMLQVLVGALGRASEQQKCSLLLLRIMAIAFIIDGGGDAVALG